MSVVSIWRQTSFWAVVAQRYKIALNILYMNGNKQVGHIIVHVLKWVCPAFLCVSATVSHDATAYREAFNSTVFFTRCSICGPREFTAQQYSPFTYGDKKTLGYFTASVLPHRLILLLLGFFLILIFFFFHCHCHCSLNQASGTIKDVWQNSIQTPWLHTLVANYWRCMPTELRLNLYTSPPPALVRTTLHTWTATSQKYTPTLFHSFLCHITSSKQVHSFFLIPICLNCIDLFRQDPCPLNRHSFNPSSCPLWVHHQQSYPLGDRL